MLHVLLGVLLLTVQAAPLPMGPTDAIGFDYEIAELIDKQVTHFERRSDTATSQGSWASLGIPVIVAGAPEGWNTYRYMPGSAFDVPVTIYFRACNVQGCGPASEPFAFVRVSTGPGPTLASPANVRRLPGTT